jgi:hypothetical protein
MDPQRRERCGTYRVGFCVFVFCGCAVVVVSAA